MSNFFPVYNRTSDALNQKRLSSTLQSNQVRLNQLQQQIATGHRIGAPSEDPTSALRAIRYQASLEQATQYGRNLESNKSYLDATDGQVRAVNDLLTQLRGETVTWASSPLSEGEREAAISELSGFRNQLLGIANTKYNGRYLFAGSNPAQQPFALQAGGVQFNGNDGQLFGITTADQVLQSNLSAQQVFGGVSKAVSGSVTLRPTLSESTRLSDLRGGAGVNLGTLEISDGVTRSRINLSSAETVGDVVRAIEANAPAGKQLSVEIKNDRLEVRLLGGDTGQLSISESNGGSIAADLGLKTGVGRTEDDRTIVGQSLSPRLTLNTPLQQTVGSPALAYLSSPGQKNDIVFQAKNNGSEYNHLNIQYVDSNLLQAGPGVNVGSEEVYFEANARAASVGLPFSGAGNDLRLSANTPGSQWNNVKVQIYSAGSIGDSAQVVFDSVSKTLSIGIDSANNTSVASLRAAIDAEGTFSAAPDTTLAANSVYDPNARILASDAGLNRSTGNSGGDANTVYIHVSPNQTATRHVLSALNKHPELSAAYSFEVDSTDGALSQGPLNSLIDPTATATTGGGSGVNFDFDSGIQINVDDQTFDVSLTGVNTVEQLINRINASGSGAFARINPQSSGIDVGIKTAGVSFSIGENGGQTATQLGIRSLSRNTRVADLNFGNGLGSQPGTDFTIIRNDGSQFDVDVSAAKNVGNVLDLINQHPDNQDPNSQVIARLAITGNGIELVDDNPTGSTPITVQRRFGSLAAENLGLVPVGQEFGYPQNAPATAAAVDIVFPDVAGLNRSFAITANQAGAQFNGVQLEIVSGATGDQATATYDATNRKLTVQVDTGNTRTQTLVDAINDTGVFRASLLNNQADVYNTGAGIVSQTGIIGTLTGGSSRSAAIGASAILRPTAPNQLNTAIDLVANQGGTALNGVAVIVQNGASGDAANAVFDPASRQLIISIDPAATTSNTIIAAINAQGTFAASLNTQIDPSNSGNGVFGQTGLQARTADGAPGVLRGRDVNPQENESIFNTIDRMIAALQDTSESGKVAFDRSAQLLEVDIERISSALADVGARNQFNDFLIFQNEDLQINLQENLSNEIDTDLVSAISELTAQQASVEASLRMLSQTFQASLFDFI